MTYGQPDRVKKRKAPQAQVLIPGFFIPKTDELYRLVGRPSRGFEGGSKVAVQVERHGEWHTVSLRELPV